jgi:hypothetical protein
MNNRATGKLDSKEHRAIYRESVRFASGIDRADRFAELWAISLAGQPGSGQGSLVQSVGH